MQPEIANTANFANVHKSPVIETRIEDDIVFDDQYPFFVLRLCHFGYYVDMARSAANF